MHLPLIVTLLLVAFPNGGSMQTGSTLPCNPGMTRTTTPYGSYCVPAPASSAQQSSSGATLIESLMTPDERLATGVTGLTASQKQALSEWIVRYSMRLLQPAASPAPAAPAPRVPLLQSSDAIESQIDGEFHGWSGETIFKLTNGQIWQQTEYDYTYEYAYRPDVVIYKTASCYKLKVEDVEDTICVRRLK